MSSAITRRSRNDSGTSPETIRRARPSTIAVLPTPGSPISTGLFLVRLDSTWITRRISSSRPITGSSLPCSAISVRSRPKRSSGLWSSRVAPWGLDWDASGGAIAALLRARAEGRAGVGGTHQLEAATVRHQPLCAEGAAPLLELVAQLHLRLQRLQLHLLDAGLPLVDLLLEAEHALHARQAEAERRGQIGR